MADPDGAVLRRAASGDADAFSDLYERHRRPIFRFAYRMLGSVSLAEDVTHECFVFLLTEPGRFDPERAPLRTFLWGVTRNLALKQLRLRGVDTTDDALDSWTGDGAAVPTPLGRLLEQERSTAVREAVLALPPLQREVVVLFEYEELSLAETAAIVAVDVGTVKARLHRARERLRRVLAPQLGPAPRVRPKLARMA